MNFDPDLKECQIAMKLLRKTQNLKEEATEIFKSGNYKEAICKFDDCIALDPLNHIFNATLLLNISIAHEKLGNKVEKLESLN